MKKSPQDETNQLDLEELKLIRQLLRDKEHIMRILGVNKNSTKDLTKGVGSGYRAYKTVTFALVKINKMIEAKEAAEKE